MIKNEAVILTQRCLRLAVVWDLAASKHKNTLNILTGLYRILTNPYQFRRK